MPAVILASALGAVAAQQPGTQAPGTQGPGTQPAGAPEPSGPSRTPLTLKPFETAREMVDFSAGGVQVWLDPPRAPTGGGARRALFRLPLAGRSRPVPGVLGQSVQNGTYDRLWLDWNANKKVDAGEHYSASPEEGGARFGPLQVPGRAAVPAPYLVLHQDSHVHLVPSARYEGELRLGSRAVRLAAVDANVNGALGERGILGQEGDLLLLDLNGDGRFTGASEGWSARPWELEALPMRELVQMPDGAYYRVMVPRDGNALTAEPDRRPTGRLRLPCARFAMEAVAGDERLWVRGPTNEVTLPAGSYMVPWLVMAAGDPAQGLWTASIVPRRPAAERDRLHVEAGQTAELRGGPPFRSQLASRGAGRRRTFQLSLVDQAGNPVLEVLGPDGRRPPAPEVRLTDATGRVVKAGRLPYGAEFRCYAAWNLPVSPRGRLQTEVEWPLGPFTPSEALGPQRE